MKLALPLGFSSQILIYCLLSSVVTTTPGCGTEVGNGFAPNDPDDPPTQQQQENIHPNPDDAHSPADDKSNVEANHTWSESESLSWDNLQAAPTFLLTSCNGPLHKIIMDAGETTHFELSSEVSIKKINLIKSTTNKWEIFSDSDLKYSFELQDEQLVEAFDENSNQVALLN
ncbi:MAG: hypothetical protein KBD78_14025, partial [Oligoflexales bacterium]|nr:hypothetical protein [Oligoflexales bacterium]